MSHAEQSSSKVVQEAVGEKPVPGYLKPERIQQQLARMLGWEELPEASGLRRVRRFGSPMEAEAFAGLVFKLAARRQQRVKVALAGKQVQVTIEGRPGRAAGLTDAVYNLACALG